MDQTTLSSCVEGETVACTCFQDMQPIRAESCVFVDVCMHVTNIMVPLSSPCVHIHLRTDNCTHAHVLVQLWPNLLLPPGAQLPYKWWYHVLWTGNVRRMWHL